MTVPANPAPSSATVTILSGDLSVLGRASAFGEMTPYVEVDDPLNPSAPYSFLWDLVDSAVHVNRFWVELVSPEMNGYGLNFRLYGSNDSSSWDEITISFNLETDNNRYEMSSRIWRVFFIATTPNFYRYFRLDATFSPPSLGA